eukprot:gene10525-14141_t
MSTSVHWLSSLIYFIVSYPILSWCLSDGKKISRTKLVALIVISIASITMKAMYDIQELGVNHYKLLEIGRHSSTFEIRRAYKKLSKIYHPDKFTDKTGSDKFQDIKTAYDLLMDEQQRDIYNRFGDQGLDFDPRKDEMKLISDMSLVYLFWGVTAYIMTLPIGARTSRNWIIIFGIAVLAVEVCFRLTETVTPKWLPDTMTESEIIFYLHMLFPLAITFFRGLAQYLYVDIDQTSIAVLKGVSQNQKAMSELMSQLQVLLEEPVNTESKDSIETIKVKIEEVRSNLDNYNDSTYQFIEELKNASSNPGSNYYWILFVIMYGGIYFMQ